MIALLLNYDLQSLSQRKFASISGEKDDFVVNKCSINQINLNRNSSIFRN